MIPHWKPPAVPRGDVRYIAKCRQCGTATSALVTPEDFRASRMHADTENIRDPEARAAYAARHPSAASGLYWIRGDTALNCRQCGRPKWAEPVRGVLRPEIRCNAKCMASKGPQCECSCGGANHGASYSTGGT